MDGNDLTEHWIPSFHIHFGQFRIRFSNLSNLKGVVSNLLNSGYAPGRGTGRFTEPAMIALQNQKITNMRLRDFWPKPGVGKLRYEQRQ